MRHWLAVLLLPFALSGVVQAQQAAETPDEQIGAFEMLIEATKAAQTEAAECREDRAACDAAVRAQQTVNMQLRQEVEMLSRQIAEVNERIASMQAALAEKEAQRAEAIRTAPQRTIEQVVRGEVSKPVRTLIADALIIAEKNDAIAAIDAEKARTMAVPLAALVDYLPPERMRALKGLGITELVVIKAADGSIAYVYAPSKAGIAPLNWRGAGVGYEAFINAFASLNPEVVTIDRGKLDWTRTKPGLWKIKVVKAEQAVQAKPKSSPKRAASKRSDRPAKAKARTAQKAGNRVSDEVRDFAAQEMADMRGQSKPAAQSTLRSETATSTPKGSGTIVSAKSAIDRLAKVSGKTPEQLLANVGKPGGLQGTCAADARGKAADPCFFNYGTTKFQVPSAEFMAVAKATRSKTR